MRRTFALLIVLGLLVAVVSTAQAQETSYIWLAIPRTYTVSENDNVVMAVGWSACNKGLADRYIDAINMEFKLNGITFYERCAVS